ncbi:MAG: alpha/beta hydrolase [Candidatus Limnocylindrales bacterium]
MPGPEPSRERVRAAADVCLSIIARGPSPDPSTRIPVLLVHGLASNARMWDGVGEALARLGHPSVAVDQRGHGRSDAPDTGYDFETLTTDLVAVMDATGLARAVVAGQSWGAHVVLELAVRHPDRVSGVVCVDGGLGLLREVFPDWPTAERGMTPPDLVGTPRRVLEARFRAGHPDWPESGIEGALENFRVRDDGTIEPWLTRTRHMVIARHLWEHDPVARYADLTVPALLLVAERPAGEPLRRRAVEAVVAAAPGVRVEWFRPGDHDLHAQYPERVAAAIATFAQDVPA